MRSDAWQQHLSAVRMPGKHERDIQQRGLRESAGIVRQQDRRRTGALQDLGQVRDSRVQ